METMIKKYLFIFCSFFTATLFGNSNDKLVIGTNAEFPPFCSIENGDIVGFDIDVAKEVAKRLGRDFQLKDMPFDALIPATVLNQLDFVAAGMSSTEERAKRVLFTKPYLTEDPLVILTPALKPINTVEELVGKKSVVIEGFTADLYLSSKKGMKIIRLPAQADGFLAIKSERADAFITAQSTVNAFFERNPSSEFHLAVIEGTGETCALVLPKKKADLLEKIKSALDGMGKDGTLDQLKIKWKLK